MSDKTPDQKDQPLSDQQVADYAYSVQSQLNDAHQFPSAAYLKGKKRFCIQGFEVIVDERYEVTHMIGSGAYGVVWSAFDKVNNEEVAIKKIQTAFNRAIDAKRILREIKILSKCLACLTLPRILRPRKHHQAD